METWRFRLRRRRGYPSPEGRRSHLGARAGAAREDRERGGRGEITHPGTARGEGALGIRSRPRGARAIDDGEDCAQDGTDYEYAEAIVGPSKTIRKVSTNHCPNHPFFNLNPHTAIATATGYQLPAYPMYSIGQRTDLSETGGGTGVTIDGGIIYSGYGGPTYGRMTGYETSAPYVEGDTFDQCGGHSSSDTEPSYHYHVPPVCLLRQLGAAEGVPSPQVGWMLDGFPIYGPLGPGGAAMKTCAVTGGTFGVDDCTDDCGGYYEDCYS